MGLVQIDALSSSELLDEKYKKLQDLLRDMGSVVIGMSGGVDSTLLARVAHDVLGDRALSVIGDSQTFPEQELIDARDMSREIGIRFVAVLTHELAREEFANNSPDRCYYCKTELYGKLGELAHQMGYAWALDGSQIDDLGDYRPGMKAGHEKGVRSPFIEVGMNKADIRALSHRLGLPTADKPSLACLSSRFPYGTRITAENLTRIDGAEAFVRRLGFRQVRVRYHDEQTARIELPREDFGRLIQPEILDAITERLGELQFHHVTLDLKGYRSGSQNELLSGRLPGVTEIRRQAQDTEINQLPNGAQTLAAPSIGG